MAHPALRPLPCTPRATVVLGLAWLLLAACAATPSPDQTLAPTAARPSTAAGQPTAPAAATPALTPRRPPDSLPASATPPAAPTARVLALQSPWLQGEDVRQVEQQLLALGYAEVGEPDGVYDEQSAAAVKHFQWLNGLPLTGEAEPQTQAALMAAAAVPYTLAPAFPGRALSRGSTAALCDDHQLQERLSALGYLDPTRPEWAEGKFGPATEAAVKAFQTAHALPADGIVNLATWERLFSPAAQPAGAAAPPLADPPVWASTIFAVGAGPDQLAYDGTRLWVTARDALNGTDYVVMLDPATGQVSAPIRLGDCPARPDLAAQPVNLLFAERLWVMLSDAARLQTVSAAGTVGPPVELFPACQAGAVCVGSSALGFDGAVLWAGAGDDTLVGVDPQTGAQVATRTADWLAAGDMIFDGQCLWYAASGTVQRFGPNGAACAGYLGLEAVALAFDGERLWLSTGAEVGAVDAGAADLAGETITFYPVGAGPRALAYDAGRQWLWVANADDNTVQAIDTRTGAVTDPIPVGRRPSALLFDGARLWVANQDSGTVQSLDPARVVMPVVTPAPTVTPAATPTLPPLARSLALKSPPLTGDDVRLLQNRLLALGYTEVGTADGSFGQKTDAAVRHFQELNALTVDGVVGPHTWAVLFGGQAIGPGAAGTPAATTAAGRVLSLQSPPMTGADVEQLQDQLRQLNYLGCRAPTDVVDGSFGLQTEAAVRRFQAANGLEANGLVGAETWAMFPTAAAAPEARGPLPLPPPVSLPPGSGGLVALVMDLYGQAQIVGLDVDLGTLSWQLTEQGNNYDPAWSPDGRRLAYVSDQSGRNELYVASADGSGAVQLTCGESAKASPAWSPDGTQLVFTVADPAAGSRLFIIRADGTALTALPVPPKSSLPAWSRGGQIAFVSQADGDADIYVINPDGSGLTALTTNRAQDWDPVWTPAGAPMGGGQLLFSTDRTGASQLYVMQPDGTDPHLAMPVDYADWQALGARVTLRSPSWSPDGRRLVFQLTGAGTILGAVNADGSGLVWYSIDLPWQPDWMP